MSDTADVDAPLTPIKAILADITAYEREYKPWIDRGRGIIERYRDARPEPVNQTFVTRKFNILWANVETLKPTLYARLPQVAVERRFKDSDAIGNLACEVAERLGNYIIQTSGADGIFRQCVHDRLLPGRAIAWVSYEVEGTDKEIEPPSDQNETSEAEAKETQFEKTHEAVNPEYVDWEDFGHSPVRTWSEVKRVWRKRYLTRQELVDRFGEELGNDIPLDRKTRGKDDKTDFVVPQATIYEIWDKPSGKVYWTSKDYKSDEPLDTQDPPIKLESFWPCPQPLWSTVTNDTLIPIPDYVLYQDQANELDIVTNRIARITDALKIGGTYDSAVPELERLLQPNGSPDNMLIGVSQWAAFMEKGGLAGAIQLLPIDMISGTLLQLYTAREQIIQVIYQVTGISDILRGASDPNETATAQQIKSQTGSVRIRDTQAEVARFCRDTCRIIIECAIQMFEPKLIAQMTMASSFCPMDPQEQQQAQVLQQMGQEPPPPKAFLQAFAMLKNDQMRSFHIDIETDSTIALDEAQDKQSATEFLGVVSQFIQQAGPVFQAMPQMAPMLGEMLLFTVRRYRAGRTMEGTIESTISQITQQAQQNAGQQKPDPALQIEQQKTQQKQMDLQAEAQTKAAELQSNEKIEAAANQIKQAELQLKQQELELEKQKQELAEWVAMHEAQLAREKAQAEALDHPEGARLPNVVPKKAPQIGPEHITALTNAIAMMAAPKKTNLLRGPDGKAIGAISTPMN